MRVTLDIIFCVVSNICKYFESYPLSGYGGLIDAYGVSMRHHLIHYPTKRDNKENIAFECDEVICMEYEITDGNKYQLSYYNESKDNQLVFSMDLPSMIEWMKIRSWFLLYLSSRIGLFSAYSNCKLKLVIT